MNNKPYKKMNNLERELYEIHFKHEDDNKSKREIEIERNKRVQKVCFYKFKKRILKKISSSKFNTGKNN